MAEGIEIVWLRSADDDVQSMFNWLEDQSEGLGIQLLIGIDAAVEQLKNHPASGSIERMDDRLRRLLVPGFSCGIFYQIVNERLLINSVLDLRQDPETIRRRLDELL